MAIVFECKDGAAMNIKDAFRTLRFDKEKSQGYHQLYTKWGEYIDPDHVLTEYPRPQLRRDNYTILNGYWNYCITKEDEWPSSFDDEILVPFSPESELSGVRRHLQPDEILWYERELPIVDVYEGYRCILHFGAVDQFCEVYVNRQKVTEHMGGYLPFSCDITSFLTGEKNTLTVKVIDKSDTSYHSRGKQKLNRGGMFYTAQSGIWQTVWMEWVPDKYIEKIRITPLVDESAIYLEIIQNTNNMQNNQENPPEIIESLREFIEAMESTIGSTNETTKETENAANENELTKETVSNLTQEDYENVDSRIDSNRNNGNNYSNASITEEQKVNPDINHAADMNNAEESLTAGMNANSNISNTDEEAAKGVMEISNIATTDEEKAEEFKAGNFQCAMACKEEITVGNFYERYICKQWKVIYADDYDIRHEDEYHVYIYADNQLVQSIASREPVMKIPIPNAHLWSPEDPFLYDMIIIAGNDKIASYFAMRKVEIRKDSEGIPRIYLNNEVYFQNGLLDQGYWPDGLYTAPSDEALIYDIKLAKDLGFNMLRKHLKIEPLRWYYHCDRLGMLVWQDMVNGGRDYNMLLVGYLPTLFPKLAAFVKDKHYRWFGRKDEEGRQEWLKECKETVEHLYNCPCVVVWVPFNEGWGQFDAKQVYEMIKTVDKTRLIDHASGWFDQKAGDFKSIHNYFHPLKVKSETRPVVFSEYGGFACYIPEHSYSWQIYGYRIYLTMKELNDAYQKLMTINIESLKKQGLSAAVYTQLSDIEDEVNGLVTYDRKICKVKPIEKSSG